jgi:hypothetical protein
MRNLRFSGNYFGEVVTLQQINKTTTKKLFAKGERVLIQSSNFVPLGIWSKGFELNKEDEFEYQVNSFKWYNCLNSETGKHVTFYKIS